MTRTDLVAEYAKFFKSEGGLDLLKELDRQINESHEAAEEDPDHAKDFVLTAKAAREIKAHISRMCIAGSKVVR